MSIEAKDPDDRLDYAYDWRNPPEGEDDGYLDEDETIASYTFEVAQGEVEVDADAELDGVVTVWLTGGTPGAKAKVTCQIVSSLGRRVSRTMTIPVKER